MTVFHNSLRWLCTASFVTISALALSGCGGSGGAKNSFAPHAAFGPAIYGLQASLANPFQAAPDYLEISGLGSPDNPSSLAYFTSVQDLGFKTVAGNPPSQAYLNTTNSDGSPTLPQGWPSGGQYIDANLKSLGGAATPGGSYQFRVAISNGQNASGTVLTINPATVKLSSPAFSISPETMTFDASNLSGPLANGTYKAPLTIPTGLVSGIYPVVVQASDTGGNSTQTTFQVLVLARGGTAIFAQAIQTVAGNQTVTPTVPAAYVNIAPGDSVELTTASGTVLQTQTADPTGTALFIAPPGSYGLVDTTQKNLTNIAPLIVASPSGGHSSEVLVQYSDNREGSAGTMDVP